MAGRQYIGGPQKIGKAVQVALIIPAGSLADDDVFRPVFVDNRLEFVRNGFQGLIPGDLFPLPVGLLHRMNNPVRMIRELGHGQAFGTHRTPADGGVGISLHFNHLAVFHLGDHAAGTVTISANGFDFLDFSHKQPPY